MCVGQIYSLTDPRNGNVRYIGQTTRTIKQRLVEHIYQAKHNNYRTSTWIKSLLALNMKPMINPIVTAPVENLDLIEENYISHYKQFCKLTNHKPGGKSRRGYKVPIEIIEKIRATGVYEKSRKRMLGENNPGKKQIKTKFPVKKTEEEKLIARRACSERMKKNNPATKYGKPILQYTLDGVFIKEWKSLKEIEKTLNRNCKGVRQCCRGHKFYKQSQGFIWKYKPLNTNKNVL